MNGRRREKTMNTMNKKKAVSLVLMLLLLTVMLGALVFVMGQNESLTSGTIEQDGRTDLLAFTQGTRVHTGTSGSGGASSTGSVTEERTETVISTNTTNTPPMVGGDRDAHGCIGSAGFSWDTTIAACIRPWELNDAKRSAARQAVQAAGSQYGTTITSVEQTGCAECFTVTIQTPTSRSVVTIQKTASKATQ